MTPLINAEGVEFMPGSMCGLRVVYFVVLANHNQCDMSGAMAKRNCQRPVSTQAYESTQ